MLLENLYSRRQIIKSSAALAGLSIIAPWWEVFASAHQAKYKISTCDWSINKGSDVEALAFAKKIGFDGVQVSLGTVANNMHLRRPEVQQAYKDAAKKQGVQISSLAIGELNNVPYKSEPVTEEWVSDSIDVAKAMGCKVILLAFFGKGDLRGDEAGIQEVIRRLMKVAPKAEKAGIILGIESWLSADDHLKIIQAVGSQNVRVYYDVANSTQMGYDIYEEMSRLGKEYICEVHAKENGFLLGQGKVDFVRLKKVLDDMGFEGWVIIEGALPEGADLYKSYVTNLKYLRSVLNKA
ncbi:sugar phosphate isomerase/epimerase [Adhaeribacter arboris]|uniref:Sugar phosphate isomerase/epimerase n=1 Tax=Adhaeribacter arboris TaxID=2072846 RepID=A0A2T2YP53_9BACT|nr:sugar phosphate isomerase/epimerase family protein [Adhaeribacter arboris]PSR57259.1 sugar phosphate isomerase/epimerase [Adhaeribacter arboris]